jgi:RNA polymerase sigma factor (sigma-70 family)
VMMWEKDQEELRLVQQCLKGDNDAWDRLVFLHYPRISAIVRWQKWGLEHHEHEDLIQDTLEQLVISLRKFEAGSNLGAFIHTIAVRCCIARLRERKAAKRHAQGGHIPFDMVEDLCTGESLNLPGNPFMNPEQTLAARQEVHLFKRALGFLSEKCNELIRLRIFDDLPFADIAARLDEKTNTVMVQMKRCLLRIAEHVQSEG